MQEDIRKNFDVPAARAVVDVVHRAGGEARFVGGCVRDAVLGVPFQDYDLAVTLLPQTVLKAFQEAGYKVVPLGLAHGTVMVICEGQPFELTTLRRDVRTHGRHAEVAFTDDWAVDAARRDFTMNAIFSDVNGHITDYFGGVEDALEGRVRFVGEARTRIREDVLRILRFFRFYARYGRGEPDEDAIAACRDLVDLLPGLSAERVSAELMKLLAASDPVPSVMLMREIGVFKVLDLPLDCFERFRRVVRFATSCEDVLRLWALVSDDADYDELGQKLRLPKSVVLRLEQIRKLVVEDSVFEDDADPFSQAKSLRLAYLYGVRAVLDAAAVAGVREAEFWLKEWQRPRFPLRGGDVMAVGKRSGLPLKGKKIGAYLKSLELWWIAQDFRPDRSACLAELQYRVDRDAGITPYSG